MLLVILITATANVAAQGAPGMARAWTSSADGKYKLSKVDDASVMGSQESAGLDQWKLSMWEKSEQKQEIKGFGACVTDNIVAAFSRLSWRQRAEVLRELVGAAGLSFNLMRYTIAGSDLTNDTRRPTRTTTTAARSMLA
ncbi:hypothetical protein HIM_08846 [Hirsutella minnesotensis 3608]|uniref:Uncharacterized protein n=1 Tax=Hirsutella minnesotensis 3608 TaxID=1043627 RepID=A0A0F7ZGZ7_9HYPO|nr:hypothetical protein HIM_08846 [Hirsutella minnesotensis 3608]